MSQWRVIITDTESMTGVAPICEAVEHVATAMANDVEGSAAACDGPLVFDCCPWPHIEIWGEGSARAVAALLNECGAEACS